MIQRTVIIMLLVMFFSVSVAGEALAEEVGQSSAGLDSPGPVLTAEEAARINTGITLTVAPGTPIQAIIPGTVHRSSNDSENETGFGRFVETRHEHQYVFKGREVIAEFFILFANLEQVDVHTDQIITGGQQIGVVGDSSSRYWPDNKLMLAVYTQNDAPILRLWSGGDPVEVAGVLWWNPSFMLGNE